MKEKYIHSLNIYAAEFVFYQQETAVKNIYIYLWAIEYTVCVSTEE